ncbi:SLC18A2 [Branchiostoma lanceolatum]|uniref:SLC18A2 protein n=1 Tax=Branchiostoma lanceolatum TaxID=7740 RepID=A0A8J9V759_BRALA|nr:SLC18A2 [Branchiostoma lanceolatum]
MFHDSRASFNSFRKSKVLVVFVTILAVFGDTLLDTVVDPIMPDYLYRLKHPNSTGDVITHYVPNEQLTTSGNIRTTESCNEGATCPPAVNTSKLELLQRAEELKEQSVRVGVLYATKATVALITNPIAGYLTDRFGTNVPLYIGLVVVFSSTVAYAFSTSYAALFASRAVQGLGSSFSNVAAFAMIVAAFPDKVERNKNVGFANAGRNLGVLVGPIIGGTMYQFLGYSSPFLLIAGMTLVDGILRLLLPRRETSANEDEGDYPLFNMLKDPYVMTTTAFLFVEMTTELLIWGSVPVVMMITMDATAWQQGVGLLPTGVGFLVGAFTEPKLEGKAGCWMMTLLGSVGFGIFTTILPLCRNIPQMIAPYFIVGIARGITETTLMTEIGYLADIRHDSKYGRAYAIAETANCLGIAVGLGMSGALLNALGFPWMIRMAGLTNLLLSPAALLLRNPPRRQQMDKLAIVYTEENQLKTLLHRPQPQD